MRSFQDLGRRRPHILLLRWLILAVRYSRRQRAAVRRFPELTPVFNQLRRQQAEVWQLRWPMPVFDDLGRRLAHFRQLCWLNLFFDRIGGRRTDVRLVLGLMPAFDELGRQRANVRLLLVEPSCLREQRLGIVESTLGQRLAGVGETAIYDALPDPRFERGMG